MAAILGAISYYFLKRARKCSNLSKVYVEESPPGQSYDPYDFEMNSQITSFELSSKLFVHNDQRTKKFLNITQQSRPEIRLEEAEDE